MNEKLNNFIHSKLFIIVLVLVLIITTTLVGTYAWFTWSNPSDQNTIFTMSIGEIADVTFTDGNAIEGELSPVYNYYDGLSTSFSVNNKAGYELSYKIMFNITSIDSELITEQVKYTVLEGETIVSDGNLSNASNGSEIVLGTGTLLTGISNYKIYFYIDGNIENNSNMMNKTISGNIMVEANKNFINAIEHITNLYLNNKNKVVANNNIEYQYAESVNLMNDRLGGTTSDYDAGNIRYYGANPNNYVDIGDRYSSGKVISYRIIGIFKDIELADGTKKDLIKVIRADSIGSYSWDNKTNGIGSSINDSGSNDWTDARLMMLLNPGYDKDAGGNAYSSTNPLKDASGDIIYGYEGSLWWNSKSGTCYLGSSNATKTCDFTSTGLSNNVQNKIEEVVWNLGGNSTLSVYSDVMYTAERGTTVYTGRPTEWTGKVALMYSSDFGYATDFNSCTSTLYSYSASTNSFACSKNDWLFNGTYQWQLTPYSSYSDNACFVNSTEFLRSGNVDDDFRVRPVLYLSSELGIESGKGTIEEPYVLG